jgi:hypothetical protein
MARRELISPKSDVRKRAMTKMKSGQDDRGDRKTH